jgi:hypothetical protein
VGHPAREKHVRRSSMNMRAMRPPKEVKANQTFRELPLRLTLLHWHSATGKSFVCTWPYSFSIHECRGATLVARCAAQQSRAHPPFSSFLVLVSLGNCLFRHRDYASTLLNFGPPWASPRSSFRRNPTSISCSITKNREGF